MEEKVQETEQGVSTSCTLWITIFVVLIGVGFFKTMDRGKEEVNAESHF